MSADAEATAPTTVRATWRGDRRYEIGKPGGATSIIDGAWEQGPGPVDSVLGALAACSAMDIVKYLETRRTPATSLDILINAERRANAPRRIVRASLEIVIDGEGIELPHAERAITLAFHTYCSVASSLAPDIYIETILVLNGEAHPAVPQRGVAVTT